MPHSSAMMEYPVQPIAKGTTLKVYVVEGQLFQYPVLCFAQSMFPSLNLKPSAWSDGHRPHTVNITCRGVTGTARMLHALTHSSISRQVREQM